MHRSITTHLKQQAPTYNLPDPRSPFDVPASQRIANLIQTLRIFQRQIR